jgi:predicted CxxxxCH...CXXCH cytochrome family protein
MRSPSFALLAAVASAVALSACDTARQPSGDPDGPVADLATCTRCHGDARNGNAAPPASLRGATASTERGVGAHQAHLTGGPLRGAIACADCHTVPTAVSSPGHMNGTVDVAFGALASAQGATPVWNAGQASCATVYCHGATLPGGANTTPLWAGGATQAACGSCHGVPPPESSGHPAVAGGLNACSACHPATVKPDGSIDVAGGKHVNGVLDLAGGSGCTACHGDPDRPNAAIAAAPPRGTHGETATTARAVGAHQTHLAGGSVRAAVACTECHAVPSRTPHSNGKVDLAFGPLATAGGARPSFDGAGCNSVYCHGDTLGAGGANTKPVWTRVDGTQAACGACHAIPPPPSTGHPAVSGGVTACGACHPQTVKADGTIDLAGGKHVNGAVDVVGGGCTACHGDANRQPASIAAAPPRDTKGQTSSAAVGAHLRHLTGGNLRAALACGDCHRVPGDTAHATQPLDLTWGALARTGGVTPSFDAASLNCTNYCHGATLPGGANGTPRWNGGAAEAACGSCHGIPPPAASGHPAVAATPTACAGCHPDTVTSTGTIDLAKGKHVNGVLDVANLSCTSCHGGTLAGGTGASGANPVAAAPPRGTKGETSTGTRAVGMHAQHLTSTRLSTSVTCAQCHQVPTSTGHRDGTVQVAFNGALANKSGGASWNGAGCSATYCHGNFSGGSAATVTWANATPPALGCTSCHGDPPQTGRHDKHVRGEGFACSECHGAGYSSSSVAAGTHVNGVKNVTLSGWNGTTCTLTCHGESHGGERWR